MSTSYAILFDDFSILNIIYSKKKKKPSETKA